MKRPQSLSLILKPLLLALLFAGIQCKPKDEAGPAAPQAESSDTPTPSAVQPAAAPVAKAPSLADHAAKLGFAAKLPQGTEFYVGSVNLKAHIAALKSSAWFKDVSGLMEDKTPAPTAGDKSLATLEKLFGDDVFIAGAQGFAASAAQLRNINRVYNEVYFKIIMTGGVSGAFGAAQEGAAPNPLAFMQNFLQDTATLEKLAGVINTLELPPLIAGCKVEKPEEILAVLANTKELEEKKIVVMSDLTTPQGHKFRVATMDVSTVLTDEQLKTALAALPPDTPEASRKIIEKAIADLRAKKFLVGWGSVGDHVIFACGKNLDHLKFVESPAQSLLAKPELASLAPHAAKNLTGVSYMSAASLESLNDDQPIVPMLRGAVSALRENATFKAIGEALEPQVNALSALESKVYHGEATDMVAAGWWDKGFHAESVGGLKPKFVLPGKPLRYHQLVNKPGVILGLAYHRNKEYDIAVRAWMEQLFSIAYTAAKELVKAGIAGPQGGPSFAMFELMLLPQLKSVYQADRDIDEKGLGGEIAYVIDVNGKMPNIPGMPEAAKDIKIPRISTITDVASRAELAKGWTTINETITGVAAIIGGFAGGQPGPDGQAKPPFVMPVPQSSKSGDMTTWFYTGEFFSGDLNPAASVSDKLLVLSTSKDAAEAFAADLSKPAAGGAVEGAVWRIDPSAVAEWVGKASALNPNATPEKTKELTQVLNWLKPFRVMQGRVYEDKGQWKMSLDWDVSDVVKFD
jgi:hypothetical protein